MKKRFKIKDLQSFRQLLLERRAQLTGTFEHFKEDALYGTSKRNGDLSSIPSDAGDCGTAIFDQSIALNLLANEADQIGMIDRALKRIDQGSFGSCEMCKKPIPKARLKILPFATLCVKCREAEERSNAFQSYAG